MGIGTRPALRYPALARVGIEENGRASSSNQVESLEAALKDSVLLPSSALSLHGELVMEIEDNGQGFDVDALTRPDNPAGGMGLSTMQERVAYIGGKLKIESSREKGTCVRVTIPSPIT